MYVIDSAIPLIMSKYLIHDYLLLYHIGPLECEKGP